MKRLAIFDFCSTLINRQTAMPFVDFLCEKYPSFYRNFFSYFFTLKLVARLLPGYAYKRLQILRLRGINKHCVEEAAVEYLEKYILPYENKKIVDKLKWHKKRGDTVIIVSGGFIEYIGKYAEKYNIDNVFATELDVYHNVLNGFIKGIDCMGEAKVEILKRGVDLSMYDLNNSYTYSDSMHDLPIFELVGNKIFVTKNKNFYKEGFIVLLIDH